jgi:hypothetical protein
MAYDARLSTSRCGREQAKIQHGEEEEDVTGAEGQAPQPISQADIS